MINLLLPILVGFSVANRPFANIFYLLLSICGVLLLLRIKNGSNAIVLLASLIVLYTLITYLVGFPALFDFISELRPLFALPAGVCIRHLVLRSNAKHSLSIFAVLMIAFGFYLCIASSFSFRFVGASTLPLGSVWVPTYATILYLVAGSGVISNRYLPLFVPLLILSSVNAILVALVLFLFLRLSWSLATSLSSNHIKLIDLLQPLFLPILIWISLIIYESRRSLYYVSWDYQGLTESIDRVAFYDSYIKSYFQFSNPSHVFSFIFGHGIGVSTFDWVLNLPATFLNMNTIWYDVLGSSALLFQIEILRALFSFGIFGSLFLLFSFIYPLSIDWRACFDLRFWFSSRVGFMLASLMIMSFVTITLSTTGVFIGASYVLNCVVAGNVLFLGEGSGPLPREGLDNSGSRQR